MIENPSYAQSLAVFEKNLIDNYSNFKTKANGSYKIPLVIHVLETKTAMSEITDEQIYTAIQGLNEAYRKVFCVSYFETVKLIVEPAFTVTKCI